MTETDILARLMQQAGTAPSDLVTLRAIVEEASEAGAARALERLGLSDDEAPTDLRELLSAWREAKRGVWRATLDWLVKGVLAMLLVGMAVRLGLSEWLG